MKLRESYVGWDFSGSKVDGPNDIWTMCQGLTLPKLDWQYTPDITLSNSQISGKTTLTVYTSESNEVVSTSLSLREPNSGNGIPIGDENLPADFNNKSGQWEHKLDAALIPDGNYVLLAKVTYDCNNIRLSAPMQITVSNGLLVAPNIAGMTKADANTAIVSTGLRVGTITTGYSDTVAVGRVISQTPAAGTGVGTGSAVNYVISLGKPLVPNIVSMTNTAANTAITNCSLKVGTVTTAYSDTAAKDRVISQTPAAGTTANVNSNVNYVKSLGRPVVPNIVNMTNTAANTAITNAGLNVGTVTAACHNTAAKGKVISQAPTANTTVAVGSAVNYVKSLGKPIVPNIVGTTASDSNTAIVSAQFVVGTITTAYSNTVAAGTVISQNPSAGTAANINSNVNYVKSRGKPVVPNIAGMTIATANTAIVNASLRVGSVTTDYSETLAKDQVISQTPAAGATANINSNVAYVKSLGKPPTVIVPNIVGSAASAANKVITKFKLKVGTVTTAFSDTVAAEMVISQSPGGGATANLNSNVDYVKSLGQSATVPSIVGNTAESANTAILGASLFIGTVTTAYSNTVADGNVISQTPAGGTEVAISSAVNYVKSLGKGATVPNILGMTAADANTAVTNAGLKAGTITTAYSNTIAADKVISQSQAAGTTAATGSKVDYVKSLGINPVGTWTGTWSNYGLTDILKLTLKSDRTLSGSIQLPLARYALSGTAIMPLTGTYSFNSKTNALTIACNGQTTASGFPYKAGINSTGVLTAYNKASGDYWLTTYFYYYGKWWLFDNNDQGTWTLKK
jgi:beta-lactam-binding protein with PASTA domain